MKKTVFILGFLLVVGVVWGQTWTEEDEDADYEYTIIDADSFVRIMRANEATATGVIFQYKDKSEQSQRKVIKGTKPELKGYYCVIGKIIPKTASVKSYAAFILATLMIGNSEKGIVGIAYLSTDWISSAISLKDDFEEYRRKLEILLDLISDKDE